MSVPELHACTCRLCMGTEAVTDLFAIDGDTTIDRKITACIDLKVFVGDGLPAVICKMCKNNIKNFYDFKQKCLLVDSKLRTVKVEREFRGLDNVKVDVILKQENIFKEDKEYEIPTKVKNAFDSWLSDDDSTLYTDYFTADVSVKVEKNEYESKQLNEIESLQINDNKINNKKQPRKYTKKKKTSLSQKIFQCEICGRTVKHKSVLINHIATHSGVKQFSCKICLKSFTREAHKVNHMRIHLGIKPYICEVCGRSFTKNQDLLRHKRIHSDVKNYACPRCDRKFKRSGDVHTHMRTHTGAKPYHCSTCDKSYTSHSGLVKHYKAHCKKEINLIK